VVTLTNARTNRLRHPLMKNVMLAKKLAIGRVACDGDGTAAPRVVPAKLLEAVGASGSKPVPLAASAGIDAQVNAVLEFLHSVCPT